MSVSVYDISVPVFKQMLEALATILDKAAAHCEAKKIDPNALLQARLYPDMLNFIAQIRIACDQATGVCARLTGREVPKFADSETSFADLRKRIEDTLAFARSVSRQDFEGAETRDVEIPLRAGPLRMKGLAYLENFALPNFYFHVTTAYGLLRHNGLEIGKRDYLGKFQ